MFFSILFGLACGGVVLSTIGLIKPSWVGADDREILYQSLKGWFIIGFVALFFYDADNFSLIALVISALIVVVVDFIVKVERE